MTEEWYYCQDCQRYINDRDTAIRDHRDFYHRIIKRTPPELRILYQAQGTPIKPLELEVDGVTYQIFATLLNFWSPKNYEFETMSTEFCADREYNGLMVLNYDWENLQKKLQWDYSVKHNMEILNVEALKELFREAIRKGVYEETGDSRVLKCYITLDSDLRLEKPSAKSKFVLTTLSALRALERDRLPEIRQRTKTISR